MAKPPLKLGHGVRDYIPDKNNGCDYLSLPQSLLNHIEKNGGPSGTKWRWFLYMDFYTSGVSLLTEISLKQHQDLAVDK